MRMSPLGWGGSGQRRNTQSSWPSQVTLPGMSSAFSGEHRDIGYSGDRILRSNLLKLQKHTDGLGAEKRLELHSSSNLQAWFWRRRTPPRCSVGPVDCRRECRCGKPWTAAGRRSAAHAPSLIAPWTQTLCPPALGQRRCCCYQRLGEEGRCCCWCADGCGGSEWSLLRQRDLCGDDLVA